MDITLYTYYRKQGNEDVFVRFFFFEKKSKAHEFTYCSVSQTRPRKLIAEKDN